MNPSSLRSDAAASAETLTVRLNNGLTVLAKLYKGTPCAITYANRTQAYAAAERVGGTVHGRQPFYVVVSR